MPAFIPIDVDRVRELASRGMTDVEIAETMFSIVKRKFCLRVFRCRKRHGIPLGWDRRKGCIPQRIREKHRVKTQYRGRVFLRMDQAEVRRLVAAGRTDPELTVIFGRHLATIRRFRQRHSIPPAYTTDNLPPERREERAKAMKARLPQTEAGRTRNRAARASEYGLPGWLTAKQIRVVIALVGGPMTIDDLKASLGIESKYRYQAFGGGKGNPATPRGLQRGNDLAILRTAGLIAVQHPTGKGRHLPAKYMLTVESLNMLADRSHASVHPHRRESGSGARPARLDGPRDRNGTRGHGPKSVLDPTPTRHPAEPQHDRTATGLPADQRRKSSGARRGGVDGREDRRRAAGANSRSETPGLAGARAARYRARGAEKFDYAPTPDRRGQRRRA